MPSSPTTPATAAFIESMAREQVRYESLFSEHAAVLQTDPPALQAAWARVDASPLVAKPGEFWEPPPDRVDEYMAQCEAMCRAEAHNFDDHVRIMYGAYGVLLSLVMFKIAPHPEKVKLAILRRRHELQQAMLPSSALSGSAPGPPRASAPSPPGVSPPSPPHEEAPLSKSSSAPRPLTAEEHELFQNPAHLHGQQFTLSPDDNEDDSSTYEVIAYTVKRDKSVAYEVLFADCPDPIRVDARGMERMLGDNLYIPPGEGRMRAVL